MTETFEHVRAAVRSLCGRFSAEYWRQLDAERAYPTAFVNALTEAGFLAALVPQEYARDSPGKPSEQMATASSNINWTNCLVFMLNLFLKSNDFISPNELPAKKVPTTSYRFLKKFS